MQHTVNTGNKHVLRLLPWAVAAGALAIYLATLNRWVSFSSLLQVAKVSGWTWQPDLTGPLYWLASYPMRWLPPTWIPIGLNLFSTLCAALTLALLARTVALLPHDRTYEQRAKEKSEFSLLSMGTAWAPPVIAAIVCGLQLTFWENATSASGQRADLLVAPFTNRCEMLELLLFAYVIRCLLEYRIDERDSWLRKAIFVYGLAVTNNWAMIGFLPLFIVALIRVQGLSFFTGRSLGRLLLWGLAGLLLYLLLPLVQSLSDVTRLPFWPALKYNLGGQKYMLSLMYHFFVYNKQEMLLLSLTSLLPLFIINIRWASYFGDTSPLGVKLTTFVFHSVHGLFLLICIWAALDPPFTPRSRGFGLPFMTASYLGALCVGYFFGYFLLLFGKLPQHLRRWSLLSRLMLIGTACAIWLLLAATPAALVYRNLAQIRITNGPMLRQYAALQTQALPRQGAVLLSDDPRRLLLLQSFLTQAGKSQDFLFLHTGSLPAPNYQRYLKRKYGPRWPMDVPKDRMEPFSDSAITDLLSKLAQTNALYYLHPSFGAYFETFYSEPHGLAYKLVRCPTNTLQAPRPSREMLDENETFWANLDQDTLASLAQAITPPNPEKPGFMDSLMDRACLEKAPNPDAATLGSFYSRALNDWGVELQRGADLVKPGAHFKRALELNPGNLAAEANMDFNKQLQAGKKPGGQIPKSFDEMFGQRSLDQILGECGPLDEPNLCLEQGLVFTQGGLYRQAAHLFERATVLMPNNLNAQIWLAHLQIVKQLPQEALKRVREIQAQPEKFNLNRTNQQEVLLVELSAHLAQKDAPGAEAAERAALKKYPDDRDLLVTATRVYMSYGVFSNALVSIRKALDHNPQDESLWGMAAQVYLASGSTSNAVKALNVVLAKHPGDSGLLATAAAWYMKYGLYSNAAPLIDKQLEITPDSPEALLSKGFVHLQLNGFDQAVPALTRVLTLDTNVASEVHYSAMLNRAICYLRSKQLDAAERDYMAMAKAYPKAYPVYYGLQEVAYGKKDTNGVIRNCELYLTNAPPNTGEAKTIEARLTELQPRPRDSKSGTHPNSKKTNVKNSDGQRVSNL